MAEAGRRGTDAQVSLLTASDLGMAYREAAPAGADVVIDNLNGPAAEAVLDVMAEGGRIVEVGSAVALAMRLPARAMRRGSLDVLGFAYYDAPFDQQAAAYATLCRHALAGSIAIQTSAMPLQAVAEAWSWQKAESSQRIVLVPGPASACGRRLADALRLRRRQADEAPYRQLCQDYIWVVVSNYLRLEIDAATVN